MSRLVYLDTSALFKLVVDERESAALKRFLRSWPARVVSAIARLETSRTLLRAGADRDVYSRLYLMFRHLTVLRIDDDVLARAERIAPPTLRSLDAIHLATALQLGSDLGVLVTYDKRLASAAADAALAVESPS
jgi:predicted nucleic acid-binding protein